MEIEAWGKMASLEEHMERAIRGWSMHMGADITNIMVAALQTIRQNKAMQNTAEAKLDKVLEQIAFIEKALAKPKMRWVVTGLVKISQYMVDEEVRRTETLTVEADSEDEAIAKFEKYWEDKTSEYEVYYTAHANTFRREGSPP